MKKWIQALLCAVVLIGGASLAGEFYRRGKELEKMTPTTDVAETAQAVAATTQRATETPPTTVTVTASTESETIGERKTYTGLFALQEVHFTVNDPENTRGLSTERRDHSYGVAKNGVPHDISVNFQKYFDGTGYRAITYDNKTKEKVLYLTFDCGYENGNTVKILDVLKEKKVPAAFFCTLHHIEQEPQLIARMIREGHIVGNHSDKHPDFSAISRTRMVKEIETVENYLRTQFGYSSSYFRFPEGAYSENALELVDSLGMTSVFWSCSYADWDENNPKGKQYALETLTSRLHPGAIILLHAVSPDNTAAMADIIDTARSMGYTFRSLDDYGK